MSDIPTKELCELPKSIWHISEIMDVICGHLSCKDLKSLRLVNNTFLKTTKHTFAQKSVLIAKNSLAELNVSYDDSNVKNFISVKFKGPIELDAFEAFFRIWKKITNVYFASTSFINVRERYELTPELMKDIKTILSYANKAFIFRTSAFPAIEKLLVTGTQETFLQTQIMLDGPIYPTELLMANSVFMKNGNVLSPSEWQLQPELNFSKLKKLYAEKSQKEFIFSVENLLELETCIIVGDYYAGGRIIGWHDNLKIHEILLQGLDVNLVELSPSIKKCQFSGCTFKTCKPTNLKVVAIEYQYWRIETTHLPADSSDDLTESVNLSECKDLRSLIFDSPRLNTSLLPSSLQYLKILFDCDITGKNFYINTLCLYKDISTIGPNWQKDQIDNILQHFTFGILHIEGGRINFECEFALFKNLMEEVNRQGKTMYLYCLLNYQGHRDQKYYYECIDGAGSAISEKSYFDKVKYIRVSPIVSRNFG